MLQQDEPDDFVLATGETHPVREFVEKSFAIVGTKIVWEGERDTVDEVGKCAETGKVLVRVDERYFVSAVSSRTSFPIFFARALTFFSPFHLDSDRPRLTCCTVPLQRRNAFS